MLRREVRVRSASSLSRDVSQERSFAGAADADKSVIDLEFCYRGSEAVRDPELFLGYLPAR